MIGRIRAIGPGRSWSLLVPVGSELASGAVGFGVMVQLARRLGPPGFADFEYASAVAAWWLVAVRGGFDAIVYREAARRPGLVRPLTDVLIGLRLSSALLALGVISGLAWASGGGRGWVVLVSGLALIPSALAGDVGLRAGCRFGPLALAQVARSVGLALGVVGLVGGVGDAAIAAGCVVGAEVVSSAVLLAFHGPIRPRYRRRAWAAIGRRGLVAGLLRFGRVSLYAADILILGWFAGPELGPYAAARRVGFALLAAGLVVPSLVGPRIARAWAVGTVEARGEFRRATLGVMAVAWPAAVGLAGMSGRWMPLLFGDGFAGGGIWLALVALRLPLVLGSNLQQAALVACRREGWALGLMALMVALGSAILPLGWGFGAWGVGVGMLAVEGLGAVGGRWLTGRLGLDVGWDGGVVAGCLGVGVVCRFGGDWPLGWVVMAGAGIYGLIWLAWRMLIPSPLPLGEGPGVRGEGATGEARSWTILGLARRATSLTPGPSPKGRGEADAPSATSASELAIAPGGWSS